MDKSLVLVIEDEVEINDILSDIARQCGYEVIQAFNGKQAMELFEQDNINPVLVLSDVKMPTMDGMDFIRQSLIKNLDLNICLISASDNNSDIVEALRLGVVDYIIKPFNVFAIQEKLRLMVDIGKRKAQIQKQLNSNVAINNSIKLNNLLKVKNGQKKVS